MIFKPFKPSIKEIAPFIEKVISDGKDAKLTITGFSMYPLFYDKRDDVILTKPDKLKKYDVVFYKRDNGSYVFHRIIKIEDDILTIAGDNEIKKEYPVKKSQVIAKMSSFVRKGKACSVSALWYILYSRIWLFIFPYRYTAVRVLNKLLRPFKKGRVSRHEKD